MKCEACEENEAQATLNVHGGKPYTVCMNCLIALVNCALIPKQFKNLLKNGHVDTEFLIHSDFYDEEGNALQPHGSW